MRFTIFTLVDITQTNARRTDDKKQFGQQSNYSTLLQTVTLTANAIPTVCKSYIDNINKKDFGSAYRNKHKVWEIIFENEFEDSITENILVHDLNYVPVVINLDETIKFDVSTFLTTDPVYKNIIFKFGL